MQEVNLGSYVDETSMTVEQWMNEYLNTYISDVKNSTMAAYSNDINNHINPSLGSIKLKDLSPIQVQHFYRSLTNKGLSPKTVRDIHGVLHEALDKAVKMDVVRRNVSDLCELPKNRKEEMHPLSDIQVHEFLERAKLND